MLERTNVPLPPAAGRGEQAPEHPTAPTPLLGSSPLCRDPPGYSGTAKLP